MREPAADLAARAGGMVFLQDVLGAEAEPPVRAEEHVAVAVDLRRPAELQSGPDAVRVVGGSRGEGAVGAAREVVAVLRVRGLEAVIPSAKPREHRGAAVMLAAQGLGEARLHAEPLLV